MNVALLNKYNLKFLKNFDAHNRITLGASGGGISEMLDDCFDTNTIDEFLQKIDLYANGGLDPEGDNMLHTEIYTAYIDNQSADIYLNIGDSKLLQTIPLIDLKNILIMWKEFLIQNGH
ncbi:hypothetical protein OF897_00895 [Chryseobacterium formosus]|uniref:Uncharacterized protein n=1 Tax=Chryseobacterium formosus TaxID=1537363 RepID=A0ABT3XNH9_9FLAO|nr:hypothetical protein [Chryseobacterium formosus]MCX8522480.1 hypothetical protein [Chryseobacterium formosus]